jgi:putative phosphoribosyl transferase
MERKVAPEVAEWEVEIPVGQTNIQGSLVIPDEAAGIVLFAHGSGSSRFSPRNRFVADCFHQRRLATLLIDLLTRQEEVLDMQTAELRFNIELLAERLGGATGWVVAYPHTRDLAIGYFGASTGAAAALMAAVDHADRIRAVVSRGGRPDLAMARLPYVKAPTLLIVGGYDYTVIELNRRAADQLRVDKELRIVPGATHLFEEPGALDEVARLSVEWFLKYLH